MWGIESYIGGCPLISSVSPGLSLSSHGSSRDQYQHLRLHVCRLGSTKEVKIIGSVALPPSHFIHLPAPVNDNKQTLGSSRPYLYFSFRGFWSQNPDPLGHAIISRRPTGCPCWLGARLSGKSSSGQLEAVMPHGYAAHRSCDKLRYANKGEGKNDTQSFWGAEVIHVKQCISAKGKNEMGRRSWRVV